MKTQNTILKTNINDGQGGSQDINAERKEEILDPHHPLEYTQSENHSRFRCFLFANHFADTKRREGAAEDWKERKAPSI